MTIGWYVHHHGRGHLTRFEAVRPLVADHVVVFSSLARPSLLPPETTWVQLQRDDEIEAGCDPIFASPTASGVLHWAPLGHSGHTGRLAALAARAGALTAMVVDVSVEVAVFSRVLGLPVVLMTQPGQRDDTPHRLARSLAEAVIAPWPAPVGQLQEHSADADTQSGLPATPVTHVGGISRFAGAPRVSRPIPGTVLALGGGSSDQTLTSLMRRAAAACPDLRWRFADAQSWLEDPWLELQEAEVVVSAAGQNAVADIAVARARSVIIPRPRPFGEQDATAAALDALGLAVTLRGSSRPLERGGHPRGAAALPTVASVVSAVRRATLLEPRWDAWHTEGAASRAADIIAGVAGAEVGAEPALTLAEAVG